MAGKTTIEWADRTWNPLIGCSHVSAGCDNCYAAQFALRNLADYAGLATKTDDGPRFTGEIRMRPKDLDAPLRWKTPARVFVNSMSDLFHKDVPEGFIGDVWNTMAVASQHTFQVLTKRPQRMRDLLQSWANAGWMWRRSDMHWCGPITAPFRHSSGPAPAPLPNVWLGTSIENNTYAWRADHLRATPAAVRFLSLEPLLGPVPDLDLTGIDWVIVGGESGPNARPMHPDWVRDIRNRCVGDPECTGAADCPVTHHIVGCLNGRVSDQNRPKFLFKQWGEWVPDFENFKWNEDGTKELPMLKLGKHQTGRMLDGRVWDEYPEVAQ